MQPRGWTVLAGLRGKFAEHLLLGCVQANPLQGLPRFPGALSDLWTCPGSLPPLFAVIRATKRICCLWEVGPQTSLAKHERFQRKRQLQPAGHCQESLGSTGHLQDSARVPLPRDPCLAPPLETKEILLVCYKSCFCLPKYPRTLHPASKELEKQLS